MRNLSQLKRRIKVGAKLLCLEHWQGEKQIGKTRTITGTQTNAYKFTLEGSKNIYWSYYDKASCFSFPDADTYTFTMDGKSWTLRFVEEGGAA